MPDVTITVPPEAAALITDPQAWAKALIWSAALEVVQRDAQTQGGAIVAAHVAAIVEPYLAANPDPNETSLTGQALIDANAAAAARDAAAQKAANAAPVGPVKAVSKPAARKAYGPVKRKAKAS
jgi:hypothetical protein